MKLEVVQFVNELMSSNCFIIVDRKEKACIIVDPASEKSAREIEYIDQHGLHLDFIILTHEHTDHTWGANALKERYPEAKLVCSDLCSKYSKKESRAYFLLYYDDPFYRYELKSADIIVDKDTVIDWHGKKIVILMTPGHSRGAVCLDIEGNLFTGDTIMPFPPFLKNKYSIMEDWQKSVAMIIERYSQETIVYPGHGEKLLLGEWEENKEWTTP